MSDYSVTYNKVTKKFGDNIVLDNITLKIPENKTTALVGASGSGKTTLLQLVNGLIEPTTGDIQVLGDAIDYADLSMLRKKMGYAVQGAGLFPHMTVFGNITVMANIDGWDAEKIKNRANHVIEMVDLKKELLPRFPHNLSGGQQQRVSLCRALMLNPALLLLDEPFSALDPITKGYIHEEFFKLQKAEARSILIVTHDMDEAAKLADEIVVLEKGIVVQQGTINEIIKKPANQYVEEMLQGVLL